MKKMLVWCLLGLCTGLSSYAAEPTAEDLIKYRQSGMSAIGSHMGAASQILRGQVAYKHLQQHADSLAAMLGLAGDIFPAGSREGDTNALSAIWEKPTEFAAALKQAQDAASAYRTAVSGGDPAAIGNAMRNLGGSCKGCHDDFRKPLE